MGIPADGLAINGSPLTLTCNASGSVIVNSFEWFMDSQPLPSSGEKNAVYKKETLTYADDGIYSCKATNKAGANKSDNKTLTIGKCG
jgi:hypothetical protein